MIGDPLGERLRAPARAVAFAELPAIWYRHRLRVLAPKPPSFRRDPGLPGRLRGALGQHLKLSASAEAIVERPCPWIPACALDPFFVARRLSKGLELPKPLVPFVEEDGGVLLFGCDIFGFATAWSDAVGDAMVAGLRNGILDHRGCRWRFEPMRRDCEELHGFEAAPPLAAAAVLQFSTPLEIRSGGESRVPEAAALMASVANRVSGLARWHDVLIDPAYWSSLSNRWRLMRDDRGSLLPRSWQRVSAKQHGRRVPMKGESGNLMLAGLDSELAMLIALGATTGAGSHSALGQGRYKPAFIVPEGAISSPDGSTAVAARTPTTLR